MNLHLRQFLAMYLPVVFGTMLSVSFFAFIAIPYVLGGHPGEEKMSQAALEAPVQAIDHASKI